MWAEATLSAGASGLDTAAFESYPTIQHLQFGN
jgi:hypothetical protein